MTPEERASTIHLDSICRDDFLTEDLDEVRGDIAQAIHEAQKERAIELIENCELLAKAQDPTTAGVLNGWASLMRSIYDLPAQTSIAVETVS